MSGATFSLDPPVNMPTFPGEGKARYVQLLKWSNTTGFAPLIK